jgi:hypothetical protein
MLETTTNNYKKMLSVRLTLDMYVNLIRSCKEALGLPQDKKLSKGQFSEWYRTEIENKILADGKNN